MAVQEVTIFDTPLGLYQRIQLHSKREQKEWVFQSPPWAWRNRSAHLHIGK